MQINYKFNFWNWCNNERWAWIMHYLLCGSYGNSENRKRSASASLSIVSIMIFVYGAPKGTKSQKTRILGQIWPILTHYHPGRHFLVKIRENFTYSSILRIFPHIMVYWDLHPYGTYFKKYVPYGCKSEYTIKCRKILWNVL